jgi:hypothetical protein
MNQAVMNIIIVITAEPFAEKRYMGKYPDENIKGQIL